MVSSIIGQSIDFIDKVYLPDLVAIASFYKDWAKIGGGLSSQNVLSYGDFPDRANDFSDSSILIPRGAIINGNLNEVLEVDVRDPEQIQEFVTHSWYSYDDESKGLHPFDGVTEAKFALGAGTKGSKTDIQQLDESAKYSWIKAPRWRGHPMEVGPLARYIIAYAKGEPEFKEPVDRLLSDLELPLEAIFSTLGRTAARGLEAQWAVHKMKYFYDGLLTNIKNRNLDTANIEKWEPETWPAQAQGVGYMEAPRGALGHWVKIENTKIASYQCVVPTTWNASPRDPGGQIGAYEAALMNTPMAKPEWPVEILRTVHSFDPCLACSTHIMSPDGTELTTVKTR